MTNKKPILTEEESEQALDAVYPISLMASHEGKLIQSLLRSLSETATGAVIDAYVSTGDLIVERHGDEIHILRQLYIIDREHVPKKIAAKLFPDIKMPNIKGDDKT